MENNIGLKPEKNFSRLDTAYAFAMLICGFLYWNLIHLYMLGAGVTLFTVVLVAVSYIYLSRSGVKQNTGSIICLIIIGFSAAHFALFDNQFICWLNFMFISVAFVYWICLSTGRRIDNKLSVYIIGDAVKQGLSMPFLNFGCCASGIIGFAKNKKSQGIVAAFLGILIFLPLLAAVIRLLSAADWAFENFMAKVFDFINIENIMTYIWQFIIGMPVAFYLYGIIYGNVKGRYADRLTTGAVDRAAKSIKIAPKTTIYSALTAFNAIYLIFFVVQAVYLFSAFNGYLPEAYTYAAYARRGFFELCTVAGINLSILLISQLTVKREHGEEPKALKVEIITIALFTILLITTALSKMIMYINAYGLTQLRVYTSWFMIILLLIFVAVFMRQIKKFNSARIIIAGFIIMFMALLYGNVDGQIAKYNISRYEAGTLATFDINAITGLSNAAVPYMYDLYLRTDDLEMRTALAEAISDMGARERGMITVYIKGFRDFNYQRYQADEIRRRL